MSPGKTSRGAGPGSGSGVSTPTCPDWARLAADRRTALSASGFGRQIDREIDREIGKKSHRGHRETLLTEDGDAVGSERSWRLAIEHQRGCASCREAALSQDPTLVFHRMPEIELSDEEVETMRQRVAGVRRGRAVASNHESSLTGRQSGPMYSSWLRWLSAAAVLAVAALGSLQLDAIRQASVPVKPSPITSTAQLTVDEEAALEAFLEARPLVEGAGYDASQTILMQGAAGGLDFAWIADSQVDP